MLWWLVIRLLSDGGSSVRIPVAPAETLAVTMAGAGQPVVLIPGLFGSAFSFRKLVPLLTDEQYRTVVVEPLAVGSSSRPERADYSLTAQADRIAAVLDSLRIQDAVIVAHSLGAAMGFPPG